VFASNDSGSSKIMICGCSRKSILAAIRRCKSNYSLFRLFILKYLTFFSENLFAWHGCSFGGGG